MEQFTDEELKLIFLNLSKLVDAQGEDLFLLIKQLAPILTEQGIEIADNLRERMLLIFKSVVALATLNGVTIDEIYPEEKVPSDATLH
jgi:repressor of nif and glnA expression